MQALFRRCDPSDDFELATAATEELQRLGQAVLCLEDIASNDGVGKLPLNRLDLYVTAVRCSVRRRFVGDARQLDAYKVEAALRPLLPLSQAACLLLLCLIAPRLLQPPPQAPSCPCTARRDR